MNRIILASHSKLASGMAETIRFFGGGEVEVLEQELRDTGFDARAEAILSRYANENCTAARSINAFSDCLPNITFI